MVAITHQEQRDFSVTSFAEPVRHPFCKDAHAEFFKCINAKMFRCVQGCFYRTASRLYANKKGFLTNRRKTLLLLWFLICVVFFSLLSRFEFYASSLQAQQLFFLLVSLIFG
jgi:hypothetical protein